MSCDINSQRSHTSLITTMSKLYEDTQFNQTDESMPSKEMHGILLCAPSIIKIIEGFQECRIPIHKCHIVGIMSPPAQYKPRLRKYYSSVKTHIYHDSKINQSAKRECVFLAESEGILQSG